MPFWKRQISHESASAASPAQVEDITADLIDHQPDVAIDQVPSVRDWSRLIDSPELAGEFASSMYDMAHAQHIAAYEDAVRSGLGKEDAAEAVRQQILQGDLSSIVESTPMRNMRKAYCYLPSGAVAESSRFAGAMKGFYDRSLIVWFDDEKGLKVVLDIKDKANALVSTGTVPAVMLNDGSLVNDFREWGDFCRDFDDES